MCETFSCMFWLLVIGYPGWALAITFSAGYVAGVLVLAGIRSWRLRNG